MKDFIEFHRHGYPYSIARDYIAGFIDNIIYVKRSMGYEISVDETHEQIKQLLNGNN